MTFKCLPVSGIRREIGESVNAYGVAQKPAEFIAQVEFMLFFFLSLPLFFPPSPAFSLFWLFIFNSLILSLSFFVKTTS